MPLGTFIAFSTAGAFLWSIALVFAGTQLGAHWEDIRHALQPFDLLIVVAVVALVVLFVWWRLGRPGWRRPAACRRIGVTASPPESILGVSSGAGLDLNSR